MLEAWKEYYGPKFKFLDWVPIQLKEGIMHTGPIQRLGWVEPVGAFGRWPCDERTHRWRETCPTTCDFTHLGPENLCMGPLKKEIRIEATDDYWGCYVREQ